MAKYRLDRTEPRQDGSGQIAWDIWAVDDNDLVIPGKHTTVLTPYDETQVALTPPGVANKVKALLVKYFPATGWDNDSLNQEVANNENATTVDQDVDDFVDSVGGYPVTFDA